MRCQQVTREATAVRWVRRNGSNALQSWPVKTGTAVHPSIGSVKVAQTGHRLAELHLDPTTPLHLGLPPVLQRGNLHLHKSNPFGLLRLECVQYSIPMHCFAERRQLRQR